jgi:hypothetical protein
MEMVLNVSRPLKAGGWGVGRAMSLSAVLQSQALYITDRDRAIVRILQAEVPSSAGGWPKSADPDSVDWVMDRILATGRAYWLSKDGVRLVRGPDCSGGLGWQLNLLGNQVPVLLPEDDGLVVLPGPSPWVVDPASGACGRLLQPLSRNILQSLLDMPAIPPEAAKPFADALARRFPDVGIPAPKSDVTVAVDPSPPIPVLRLSSRKPAPLSSVVPLETCSAAVGRECSICRATH